MEKGIAVTIAWPETYCKQAGAWYDPVIQAVNIGKNGYYKVGHAAIVLIDSNGNCFYFDFGRYHTPHSFGRVRDVSTDHDLKIFTKVKFDNDGEPILKNLLDELNNNASCHGDGKLRAGYIHTNFDKAYQCAKEIQQNDYLPYGPFVRKGTNCSRFVRDIALVGSKNKWVNAKLRLPWMLTPSPMWNIKATGEYIVEETILEEIKVERYEVA